MPEAERTRAFNNKPLGERFAIVVAGPLFNFIFAVLAYWIIFVVGVTGLKPLVGSVEESSVAMQAGFRVDDEITEINGQGTQTWNTALEKLVGGVIERSVATVSVRDTRGYERLLEVDLASISIDDMAQGTCWACWVSNPCARPYPPLSARLQTRAPPGRPAWRPATEW